MVKLSIALSIFTGLLCLGLTQFLIWKPGGFDRHETMVKANLAKGLGLTGFWPFDFVVELFTIIDEETQENVLSRFGAQHTFIDAGVAMLFVLLEAQREGRTLRFAALQLTLMICAAISFAFPALTVPLYQLGLDNSKAKPGAPAAKPAAASSLRTFLFAFLGVVATAVFTIRSLLPTASNAVVKRLMGVYLGLLGSALFLLVLLTFLGFAVQFKASRPKQASSYIIIAYGFLAGLCTLMWWMSILELVRHYSAIPTHLIWDRVILEATANRSAQFLLVDVVGLSFGFIFFVASQETVLNGIISFFLSFIISPSTVFCFDRLRAEIQLLSDLDRQEVREGKKHQ